jgi:hypothetical protein
MRRNVCVCVCVYRRYDGTGLALPIQDRTLETISIVNKLGLAEDGIRLGVFCSLSEIYLQSVSPATWSGAT